MILDFASFFYYLNLFFRLLWISIPFFIFLINYGDDFRFHFLFFIFYSFLRELRISVPIFLIFQFILVNTSDFATFFIHFKKKLFLRLY